MGDKVRKELILEGLDCAHCASKIEEKVKNIDGVSSANLNFITKILTLEAHENDRMEDILSTTKGIINNMEPDVIVKEKFYGSDKTTIDLMKNLHGEEHSHEHCDGHCHDHGHSHSHEEGEIGHRRELLKLLVGGLLYAVAFAFKGYEIVRIGLFAAAYFLVGGEVLLKAIKNIKRGQIFDENFLMAIATIGAFAIGEYPEGVAVMLFYQTGEFFQDIAVNRSRKSITELMNIKPDYANLLKEDKIELVSPYNVNIGDTILVKPGEKIPLDGIIVKGMSSVDTSALTGESIPRDVDEGNEVLSGFINKNGVLEVKVTKEFKESTVSKILDLVQNASSKKAQTENFITKFAKYYTPIVVICAVLIAVIPPLVVKEAHFSHWVYRALLFLVVSCPCALVISIPLSFFGGIGAASKKGILVKGSNYLEGLNNVDTVVFDKTGTLTKGVFNVTDIIENGTERDKILEYAAYAESYSNHPIALSILKEYGKEIDKSKIENYKEIAGEGISVKISDVNVLAGNEKLMNRGEISFNKLNITGTVVHIALDGVYAGCIVIADEIKKDSKKAIDALKNIGIKKIAMLTGDTEKVAVDVAKRIGIDEVHAELLPQDKVKIVEDLFEKKSNKGKLLFVGDGINDAPVLAMADIGVAMGGLGSDAAIEASDVVIMNDEISKIAESIKIAKKTRKIVLQNIIFALFIKIAVLLLGAIGFATMWEAVFADVGVALIAVLNAMRVMKD